MCQVLVKDFQLIVSPKQNSSIKSPFYKERTFYKPTQGQKDGATGLPCSPEIKTTSSQGRGTGAIPGQRTNIPHDAQCGKKILKIKTKINQNDYPQQNLRKDTATQHLNTVGNLNKTLFQTFRSLPV